MAGTREHPRAEVELEVVYHELNRFFADYTRNISKGGAFIKTFAPLKVGTHVLFQLVVPSLAAPLELEADVVRVSSKGESGMGVRFTWSDPGRRAAFEKVVEDLMVRALGPRTASELLRHSGGTGGPGSLGGA